MSMKNPLTPAGIEPATFQFVVQHLDHCATTILSDYTIYIATNCNTVVFMAVYIYIYIWIYTRYSFVLLT